MLSRNIGFLAVFLGLSLVACDQGTATSGKDAYMFEAKEYQKKTITVTMQVFESQIELDHYARDNNIKVDGLVAFSKLYPSIDKCTIFIVDPLTDYNPEFLGHEFAHCVWGRWHPKRDALEYNSGARNIR